jgi:hypothetical protein
VSKILNPRNANIKGRREYLFRPRYICVRCTPSVPNLWSLGFHASLISLFPSDRNRDGGSTNLFGWHMNSARLAFFLPISSHIILFILPPEHYSFYQPNTPYISFQDLGSFLMKFIHYVVTSLSFSYNCHIYE